MYFKKMFIIVVCWYFNCILLSTTKQFNSQKYTNINLRFFQYITNNFSM